MDLLSRGLRFGGIVLVLLLSVLALLVLFGAVPLDQLERHALTIVALVAILVVAKLAIGVLMGRPAVAAPDKEKQ